MTVYGDSSNDSQVSTPVKSSSTIAEFTEHHNFAIPEHLHEDKRAVLWLYDAKRSIDTSASSHAQRLLASGDPSWAMLLTMVDRVYEHATASVVSYFTGIWASMEVVVRATIEAAATVVYLTRTDRHLRLGQYLTYHFVTARKAIDKSDPSTRAQALQNLNSREDLIRQVTLHEGVPFPAVGWPSTVLDRFKAVGMETEYRHLYTVLSGQVHNDADALIDYVIARCLAQHDPSVTHRAAAELLYWMRFYLYSGLRYYIIAAHGYATALEFVGSITEMRRIEAAVVQHLQYLSKTFHNGHQ